MIVCNLDRTLIMESSNLDAYNFCYECRRGLGMSIHDTFTLQNQWVPIATLNTNFHGQSSATVSTHAQRLSQHEGVLSTLH